MTLTLSIIGANVLVSLICFASPQLFSQLAFSPYDIKQRNQWYRFVTSAFVHADLFHLLINMFVLFSFGRNLEFYYDNVFGAKGQIYFISLYVLAIIVAHLRSFNRHQHDPGYRSVGASGAVAAVLFANILFDPMGTIYLYAIPLPAILVGVGYVAYEYFMGRRQSDNVNHDAHLYGAIFGFLFTIVLKPALAADFVASIVHYFS